MNDDEIRIPARPLVDCPDCGLPAEVTDRFVFKGAPASVEHVKVVCVRRHRFAIPADLLPGSGPVGRSLRGRTGDEPCTAATGEEAEPPAGEHEDAVLEPDQVEEMNDQPCDPGGEAAEP